MSGEGKCFRFKQTQKQELRDTRSRPEACCQPQAAELGERNVLEWCWGPCEASGLGPPRQPLRDEETRGGLSEGAEAHPPSAPRSPPQHLDLRHSITS